MSIPALQPVRPAVPVAPYIGGKRNLARRIVERIGAIPHATYAEAFVGMGGVFLRRPFRAPCEVINDVDRDVANLFRILQRHPQSFTDELRWRLTGRTEFDRLMRENPDSLTDLERAARFLYLQRTAFGGKVAGRNFGMVRAGPARFDTTKLVAMLEDVHERLAGATIECLPYGRFIAQYDTPHTLFYLDPPYWGNEEDYGAGKFGRDDFSRLAEQLAGIRGRFLLSLNDRPEVRACFAGFAIEAVRTTYTIGSSGTGAGQVGEVLISGSGESRTPSVIPPEHHRSRLTDGDQGAEAVDVRV